MLCFYRCVCVCVKKMLKLPVLCVPCAVVLKSLMFNVHKIWSVEVIKIVDASRHI